ncbi:emopamil binding protein [Ophiostoma piceae UAMH 11346]|uniref:Emopamil binding protein n=1 Tax=Ophiostoma piceae (strain UAMH 11346) TaxID=1262450 RepID=S3CQQ7_OPHP1|nr:emopamil binding protein [Ophiostoma piceae UAMH 11346]
MADSSFAASLPPDLFDLTTLISLASTLAILGTAYTASCYALPSTAKKSTRALFIWHAFDALIHFFLEGSFLYHCFFSWMPSSSLTLGDISSGRYYMPHLDGPYLGHSDRIYGAQAGGDNPFAQLWMVYARADKRWAGANLDVISLELLTVLVMGPLACWVCYDLARGYARANVTIVVIATAEIYGGFMTFCPEWLTGNANLDLTNFMYKWVYLVFFNTLWVFIPAYALYVAISDISDAFAVRDAKAKTKKAK